MNVHAINTTDIELLAVNAARVSLSKRSFSLSINDTHLIRFLYRHAHWTPFAHPQITLRWLTDERGLSLVERFSMPGSARWVGEAPNNPHKWPLQVIERGSLWYWTRNCLLYRRHVSSIAAVLLQNAPVLAKEAGMEALAIPPDLPQDELVELFTPTDDWIAEDPLHRAPLGHATFLVEAPIPVRTQLFKHKVGFVENEVSRRYVDKPPTFFYPETWRQRAPSIKQGSLNTPVPHHRWASFIAKSVYFLSNLGYNAALLSGVCPEQARFLLPQGMETEWYWTGSLVDFSRVKRLRLHPDAQRETCQLVEQIDQLLYQMWPKSWKALSSTKSARLPPT